MKCSIYKQNNNLLHKYVVTNPPTISHGIHRFVGDHIVLREFHMDSEQLTPSMRMSENKK